MSSGSRSRADRHSSNSNDEKPAEISDAARGWLRRAAVGIYLVQLFWAPFPLGGAIAWGGGVQALLVAVCWALWALSMWGKGSEILSTARFIAIPIALVLLVLAWAFLQTLPIVPTSWSHPIWAMAADVLKQPVPATISIDPWRTDTAILQLLSYAAACWLAYALGRRSETASILLNAVIGIGAFYAGYAIVLDALGTNQAQLLYQMPMRADYMTGPFMLHNSFATYMGLATIAAVAKLFEIGTPTLIAGRGFRHSAAMITQFAVARGAPFSIAAALLCFTCLVISASRAGFAATICGLLALTLATLLAARRGASRRWAIAGTLAIIVPSLILIAVNGGLLGERFDTLIDEGGTDQVRLALWAATHRMISDSPWLGLGLGTFQDAYPLYATRIIPYVMDKAHSDYLELAAGLGLPAAIAWWIATLWAVFLCLRGIAKRKRNRLFPLVAVGASVLVAIHSSVDFSLQMPAVGISFATLLGIGLAQSFSSRTTQEAHK